MSLLLIGHYESNFDNQKGRTSVPKKFAKKLGKKAIITKGYEGSLLIVGLDEWNKIISQFSGNNFLSSFQRQTDRFLLGNAFEINLDSQGRIIIPQKLREYANLIDKVIFIGVGNRIELWSQKGWDKNEQYLSENIEKISQTLNNELKQK